MTKYTRFARSVLTYNGPQETMFISWKLTRPGRSPSSPTSAIASRLRLLRGINIPDTDAFTAAFGDSPRCFKFVQSPDHPRF